MTPVQFFNDPCTACPMKNWYSHCHILIQMECKTITDFWLIMVIYLAKSMDQDKTLQQSWSKYLRQTLVFM